MSTYLVIFTHMFAHDSRIRRPARFLSSATSRLPAAVFDLTVIYPHKFMCDGQLFYIRERERGGGGKNNKKNPNERRKV